eukprot:1833145-Alexandrium_andersonii.AAC.1
MVAAQRRGHGIRGIARVPPPMGAVNHSVNHLERPRHHVVPSVVVKLVVTAETLGIREDTGR